MIRNTVCHKLCLPYRGYFRTSWTTNLNHPYFIIYQDITTEQFPQIPGGLADESNFLTIYRTISKTENGHRKNCHLLYPVQNCQCRFNDCQVFPMIHCDKRHSQRNILVTHCTLNRLNFFQLTTRIMMDIFFVVIRKIPQNL